MNVLERNLPGIPSQRLRRTARRPVAVPAPFRRRPPVEIPVSDTYADGVPEDVRDASGPADGGEGRT